MGRDVSSRSGFQRDGGLRQKCAGIASGAEGGLLQILLQAGVRLLHSGKVGGRGGRSAGNSTAAAESRAMAEVVSCGSAMALEILLDRGEIFLSRRKVARLEIAAELTQGLSDRVSCGRSGCGTGGGLRKSCLQTGEIGLRARKIAGLEILAELLHALLRRIAGADLILVVAAA